MADPNARQIKVNGPRHENHRVWIAHFYERRGPGYEFVSTEVIPISGIC